MLLTYEKIDGRRLGPGGDGDLVVPPQWVRDRRAVPDRHSYSCFAKSRHNEFHPDALAAAMKFLREWPERKEWHRGRDLVFVGEPDAELGHLAAGLINELILRYGQTDVVDARWLDVYRAIPWIIDSRARRDSRDHIKLENAFHDCQFLWVDNPLDVRHIPDGIWLLASVVHHRKNWAKPTMYTINVPNTDNYETYIMKVLGLRNWKAIKADAEVVVL